MSYREKIQESKGKDADKRKVHYMLSKAKKMDEVKELSYYNDGLKLWKLKDEVKTLTYLQGELIKINPFDLDKWLEYQNWIEDLEFKIYSIFAWKHSRNRITSYNKKIE
jgi:hypothetical protein